MTNELKNQIFFSPKHAKQALNLSKLNKDL